MEPLSQRGGMRPANVIDAPSTFDYRKSYKPSIQITYEYSAMRNPFRVFPFETLEYWMYYKNTATTCPQCAGHRTSVTKENQREISAKTVKS